MSNFFNNTKNNTEEGHYTNSIISDTSYPEVSATVVYSLGSEVQIEQGFKSGPINLDLGAGNSIVSISREQAVALAHFIIDNVEGK